MKTKRQIKEYLTSIEANKLYQLKQQKINDIEKDIKKLIKIYNFVVQDDRYSPLHTIILNDIEALNNKIRKIQMEK